MRKRFDEELRHLNDLVLEMASLNESAIKKAISLLDEKNKNTILKMIEVMIEEEDDNPYGKEK